MSANFALDPRASFACAAPAIQQEEAWLVKRLVNFSSIRGTSSRSYAGWRSEKRSGTDSERVFNCP